MRRQGAGRLRKHHERNHRGVNLPGQMNNRCPHLSSDSCRKRRKQLLFTLSTLADWDVDLKFRGGDSCRMRGPPGVATLSARSLEDRA
jgi:hypothetical protein